jgi:ORF6N domain
MAAGGAVEGAIILIRGHRVLLDRDLAVLYGVEVKALNQAVKRNVERFPPDFMFQLTHDETRRLRSRPVTLDVQDPGISDVSSSNAGRGRYVKYRAYAFTEQGVAMLSSVLRSPRAIAVNIEIMGAFVRIRRMLQTGSQLAQKLSELEKRYDEEFQVVFDAIRALMTPEESSMPPIGFRP